MLQCGTLSCRRSISIQICTSIPLFNSSFCIQLLAFLLLFLLCLLVSFLLCFLLSLLPFFLNLVSTFFEFVCYFSQKWSAVEDWPEGIRFTNLYGVLWCTCSTLYRRWDAASIYVIFTKYFSNPILLHSNRSHRIYYYNFAADLSVIF